MSTIGEGRTRCAFIVCRFMRGGEPHVLLMRDERWGDLTLVGGHEEPKDLEDLEKTARRELVEELGSACTSGDFYLLPLTEEIPFGPALSKSAHTWKTYSFKYFAAQFTNELRIAEGRNDAGFLLKMVKERDLACEADLSNVVRVFLRLFKNKLDKIPLSWDSRDRAAAGDVDADAPREAKRPRVPEPTL